LKLCSKLVSNFTGIIPPSDYKNIYFIGVFISIAYALIFTKTDLQRLAQTLLFAEWSSVCD